MGRKLRSARSRLFPMVALMLWLLPLEARAADRWASIGPEGGSILSLVIDPATPQTLYAGTVGGGVFKSTDGGAAWSAASTGLGNVTVWSLAIDPATPQTLYVGTFNGVFKSTDGAAAWSAVNTGLGNPTVLSLSLIHI